MNQTRLNKLRLAYANDPKIFVDKDAIGNTFGENPLYLEEVHGITKSDLLQLERKGMAIKARYVIERTGEHRTRWILLTEALQ